MAWVLGYGAPRVHTSVLPSPRQLLTTVALTRKVALADPAAAGVAMTSPMSSPTPIWRVRRQGTPRLVPQTVRKGYWTKGYRTKGQSPEHPQKLMVAVMVLV